MHVRALGRLRSRSFASSLSRALPIALASLGACAAPPPQRAALPALPPRTSSIEEQVETLVRASEPRAEHRALDALVGSWRIALCEIDAAGHETELARGTAEIQWVLDARFLRWDAELLIGGTPRRTTGYLGFDLRAGFYELLMISNLATGMSVAQGSGDLARSGIRFLLDEVDPSSGTRLRMQSRLATVEAGHFVLDQLSEEGRVLRRTHYRKPSS